MVFLYSIKQSEPLLSYLQTLISHGNYVLFVTIVLNPFLFIFAWVLQSSHFWVKIRGKINQL